MKQLTRMSASVTEEEYLQGVGAEFPTLFITALDGRVLKRTTLQGGRPVILPSALPSEGVSVLKPDISHFLPGGLVPHKLLLQTVSFFQKIGKKMGTANNLEAFVFIVYDPDNGYYLHIPEQTVGQASVKYEWDSPARHIIVGDIHSHNTMGAFFSGTDDADDALKVGISGVIGNLETDQLSFKSKWRFCCGGAHNFLDLNMYEIFDIPDSPEEWTDRVTTASYPGSAFVGGGSWGGRQWSKYGYWDQGVWHPAAGTLPSVRDPKNAESSDAEWKLLNEDEFPSDAMFTEWGSRFLEEERGVYTPQSTRIIIKE